MTAPDRRRTVGARLAIAVLVVALWWLSPPAGLSVQAWRLFAIFAAALVSVVIDAWPILTASVFAVAIAVLTGVLAPEAAYAGFANATILLIVIAFLIAGAVVKCGLGARIGHWVVSRFGGSTLGLSYSIFLLDAVIAPAFPSNTARSGVLYPLAISLAEAAGARPDDPQRRRLGAFLMYSGIVSLSVSSALWLTAMAANPLGTEIARGFGVEIGFGRWLIAASVPAEHLDRLAGDLRDGAAARDLAPRNRPRGASNLRCPGCGRESARGAWTSLTPGSHGRGRFRRHGGALGVGGDHRH